jgi:hypothetical protein
MAILTSADYDMIRALLGVGDTELPDTTVEMSPFLPTAEAIIKQGITDYDSLTGDNAKLLKAGTAALCAALLCQELERNETADWRVGDYWEHGSKLDWREKAKALLRDAMRALGAITTRSFSRRTALAVAGPTRAGTHVPEKLEQWVERIVPRFVDWVEEGGEDDDWAAP